MGQATEATAPPGGPCDLVRPHLRLPGSSLPELPASNLGRCPSSPAHCPTPSPCSHTPSTGSPASVPEAPPRCPVSSVQPGSCPHPKAAHLASRPSPQLALSGAPPQQIRSCVPCRTCSALSSPIPLRLTPGAVSVNKVPAVIGYPALLTASSPRILKKVYLSINQTHI